MMGHTHDIHLTDQSLFETKCHLSLPKPNQVGFVPKLNQSNVDPEHHDQKCETRCMLPRDAKEKA